MPPPEIKKLELKGDYSELARARAEIERFVGNVLPPVDLNRMVLAVDEALANVIEHGYHEQSSETFTLEMQKEPDRFVFILEDTAEVYDPTQRTAPDLKEHALAGREGGLGVFLFTTLLEAKHEALGKTGNRLTLIKRLKVDE